MSKLLGLLEPHDIYFLIYDIIIFIPVCVVSLIVAINNDAIKTFHSVLIATFTFMICFPLLIPFSALLINYQFKKFNIQVKNDGTYLYQKINYDNIRYVDDEYKLIIPSTMRKIINFFFPFFDWYSPYKINHSIDLDKIINKDYLDEPQETDKEEVKKKLQILKILKNLYKT